MKTLRIISLIAVAVTSGYGQNDPFISDIVDNETCISCNYLSIEVESVPYTGRVVIESDELYAFLKATKKMTRSKYRSFAADLVSNNRKLDLKSFKVKVNYKTALSVGRVSENEFRIVPRNPELEKIASKGCINFVMEVFIDDFNVLKPDNKECREFILSLNRDLSTINKLSALDESFVIDQLFRWKIPVVIDHYSGLTIRRHSLAPKN